MIISRTPFRVSFFGGGTDYPGWYRQHGGSVLAATIDKYCYLTCRYLPPFFEHRTRLVYSKMETVCSIDEIQHPSARETLRFLKIDRGIEIHHDGDLPGRSGMGSSSAFTVGLLHALYALRGQIVGKRQLTEEAIHLEQDILKETVGSQDQISTAYGGLNKITFHQNGEFSVQPMTLSRERLEELNSHLMLFYTGIKRTAANVASSYVTGIGDRTTLMKRLHDCVDKSCEILSGKGDLIPFGELLHEGWQAKRELSDKVSNVEVNTVYDTARSAGAIGGKLLGAGGGGFLLMFAPPAKQSKIARQLRGLIQVPFRFEFGGSQIIFYDLERDYSEQDKARLKQQIGVFRELEADAPGSNA